MKIFVYLDESGCIHKNSSTKYFAVGGYFVFESDRLKVTSMYKRINKSIKEERNIKLNTELKATRMTKRDKIRIFKNIQDIESFIGFSKVFDKTSMRKSVLKSNIFYNYAVRLIFEDCILPVINIRGVSSKVEFIISADNRNLKAKDLMNLEDYLKMEFCKYDFDFKVTYYDSRSNFGIQLADLVVNTFYNYFTNIDLLDKVIPIMKFKKFRVSLFPGGKVLGRCYKL